MGRHRQVVVDLTEEEQTGVSLGGPSGRRPRPVATRSFGVSGVPVPSLPGPVLGPEGLVQPLAKLCKLRGGLEHAPRCPASPTVMLAQTLAPAHTYP